VNVLSPRDLFLTNFSDWDLSIPLQTQWVVNIKPKEDLDTFYITLKQYFTIDHGMLDYAIAYRQIYKMLGEGVNPTSDGLGLFFAKECLLPEDAIELAQLTMDPGNGFVQGKVISNRSSSNKILSLKLLETNLDIVDALFRPWITAAGYRGMAEIPGIPNLKADIQIKQYTRGIASGKPPLRKIHNFYDCMPFYCEGSSLAYGEEKVVDKKVDFFYNYYTYQFA
jgi:hypothetical protein